MKYILFDNEDYLILQDEAYSYILDKEAFQVNKIDLTDTDLTSKYIEIVMTGKQNKYYDIGFEEYIENEIEEEYK